jgi:hypothetical protein
MKKTNCVKRSIYIDGDLDESIRDLADAYRRSYSQTVTLLLEKGKEEVESELMGAPIW